MTDVQVLPIEKTVATAAYLDERIEKAKGIGREHPGHPILLHTYEHPGSARMAMVRAKLRHPGLEFHTSGCQLRIRFGTPPRV